MTETATASNWTLANVLTLAGILATLAISIASLVVSGKALRQARTLELAKLSSQLWDKQAHFASEFWPAIEAIAEAVGTYGFSYVQETAERVEKARLVLIRHAPFLTDEVYSSLERFLRETARMMQLSKVPLPPGEAKKKLLEEVMALMDKLFIQLGFADEQCRLRDLLHTNALSSARASALGLEKLIGK